MREIDFNNIHLVQPCMKYMDSYREAIVEYLQQRVEDFAYPKVAGKRAAMAYLQRLDNMRRGIGVPIGFVPYSAFWLVDGRQYLGSGDVRHYLNDKLRRLGGNIGYSVRPSAWRRGLGTLQLALLLDEAAGLRISKPVVTCFDVNAASARVIEKNGGVLVSKVNNRIDGQDKLTRVYQIDLTPLGGRGMIG
ncbi:MAG: GNAT family N-acetyltransferase [Defluviitaleaceae bacterium]|nr:GNAT family N-acetyltransferase [Defluviitaleaceae bacterium]